MSPAPRRRLSDSAMRALLVLLFLTVLPRDAQAYIDPGTGSLAWQLILSTVIGGTFYARRTIGHVWRAVTRRLRGGPQRGARTPTDPDVVD